MLNRRLFSICTLLAVLRCAALPALPAQSLSGRSSHAFTVADSIEMTTFSDPYTRNPVAFAKEAPDHRGFVVVTTRGILAQDELESSLWYFAKKPLEQFLVSPGDPPPVPRLLYRTKGRILTTQTDSYGSLITEVQWSKDSRHLLALVEKDHGLQHLLRIDTSTSSTVDLTPDSAGSLKAVVESGSVITFLEQSATTPLRRSKQGEAEVTLTGQSLLHILFPKQFPDPGGAYTENWQMHVSSIRQHSELAAIGFPAAAALTFQPSVSPDGTMAVIAVPVKEILPSWGRYRSAISSFQFDSIPRSTDHSGKAFDWPWEYALLDLRTRVVKPLLAAPVAWLAGYNNAQLARWSPDGSAVLLTNTFLPPADLAQSHTGSIKPCAVAEYSLQDQSVSCVVESRYPDANEYLRNAEFDHNRNRIVTEWRGRGRSARTIYERSNAAWIATVTPAIPASTDGLQLRIHQNLTSPPTLWVEDVSGRKLLWNPNPQLEAKTLARGEILHWKDASGYEWAGALLVPGTPKPPNGYPLVIQTHGFSNEHEFMPDGAFTTGNAAQPLASAGIAVLQMQDRAGRHLLPAIEEADASIAGFTSAIDHLTPRGDIDGTRIGITGFSRASWYVEKALELAPNRFRAAIIIDGVDQSYVSDVLFAPSSPMAAREHEGSNGGKPYGIDLQHWLQRSAGFNLDKVNTPLRLEAIGLPSLLGEWEIYSILSQQGKTVDLLEVPNGQHILQNPKERYASQQGAVDWYRRWLLATPGIASATHSSRQ